MIKLPIESWSAAAGRWMMLVSCVAVVCSYAVSVAAQEDLERPPPIPAEETGDVPIPPKIQDEQLEPTVTIREEEERTIEEYRFNGRVYMVKVTPKGGIPYYYVDADGDGQLEVDVDKQALNPVQPVYWKVKEWE
jgi:hypothetical protein